MRQVLHNLLANAFKYSPKQTAVVISATLHEPTTQVCISVKDAGPGIPPDELPLLFGKFVRLKRDLAGTVPGSGLGLYISKQFVEAMGGHMWAESSGQVGEGSRFCFTLRAASPAYDDLLQANQMLPARTSARATSSSGEIRESRPSSE